MDIWRASCNKYIVHCSITVTSYQNFMVPRSLEIHYPGACSSHSSANLVIMSAAALAKGDLLNVIIRKSYSCKHSSAQYIILRSHVKIFKGDAVESFRLLEDAKTHLSIVRRVSYSCSQIRKRKDNHFHNRSKLKSGLLGYGVTK